MRGSGRDFGGAVGSLYDDLGVSKDADGAAIKRAYRRKAQKAHPDKGGTVDQFKTLQLAYSVLSDDERRARYDATGELNKRNQAAEAAAEIAGMMLQLVDQVDADRTNIVKLIEQSVRDSIAERSRELLHTKAKIAKREKTIDRVGYSGKGPNVVVGVLRANIADLERIGSRIEDQIKLGEAILEMLGDYSYETDVAPILRPSSRSGEPFSRPLFFQFETSP